MSEVSEIFATSFKSAPDLIRLTLSLGWMYVTLGRSVRSARRAFEKELTRTGMSKEDAKRLSATFEELKNTVLITLKGGVFSGFSTHLKPRVEI